MKLKQDLTISDFDVRCVGCDKCVSYVTWENIETVLGKRRYKKFSDWMLGQTCTQYGVYPWDLERFLKGLPVID